MKIKLNYVLTTVLILIPLLHYIYHGFTCAFNPFITGCGGEHVSGFLAAFEMVLLIMASIIVIVWGAVKIYERDITFEIPINKKEDMYRLTDEEVLEFSEWKLNRYKVQDPLLELRDEHRSCSASVGRMKRSEVTRTRL